MAQFNFTTNIEDRMPDTGKVFCIDRMTSDYAQAHPFDADAFIESVYQEFAGTEFEESREVLHDIWTAVLSVKSQCGDASLYPNKNGARRAAAMKVWLKAGDYWRRGLRIGDTLPDMVPMTTIIRLDDGSWIALFPKDMHLLDSEEYRVKSEESTEHEPKLAVEQPTNSAEREVIETTTDCTNCTDDEPVVIDQPRPRRQRKPHVEHQPSAISHQPSSIDHQTSAISHQPSATLKALGMVAAATVALLVIYETGLLIPLGLIGLATGGILK